jgi:hypothetical protein
MQTTPDTGATQPYPRKLQVGVVSSIAILVLAFGEFLLQFLPLGAIKMGGWFLLPGGVAVFVAGLCGAYCGVPLVFRLRGFPRLVSLLSGLVSLYAILRCAGFYRWAIGLP